MHPKKILLYVTAAAGAAVVGVLLSREDLRELLFSVVSHDRVPNYDDEALADLDPAEESEATEDNSEDES